MAVNKNFVVKNGIEIATDVIVASSETKNVGVGTTVGRVLLDVKGAIGATHLSVSGVGTVVTLNSTNFTGTAGTITTLTSTDTTITNGTITNLTGTAGTITTLTSTDTTITNGNITNLTGTAGTITNFTPVNVNVSGVITATTYYGDGSNLSNVGGYWVQNGAGIHTTGSVGVGTTNPNSVVPSDNTAILNVGILTAYKLYGDGSALTGLAGNPVLQTVLDTGNTSTTGMSITGVSTFTTAEVTNGTITNLTGTAGTITNGTITNLTGTAGTITNGTITNLTGTAGTITTLTSINGTITNGTITNLTGTAGTITNFTPININATGVITATSFSGDGSGLTGAGSTVADDTTTNETFYPVFTQTTSGVITASKVSTTKFTFNPSTGEAAATNFNSTSDEILKTNVHTIENSLDIVDQLRGVSFDWKENGKSSYGVIAQELEQVLPELVAQTDPKSVNYNGIIGVLIEAVKELKKEVDDLRLHK